MPAAIVPELLSKQQQYLQLRSQLQPIELELRRHIAEVRQRLDKNEPVVPLPAVIQEHIIKWAAGNENNSLVGTNVLLKNLFRLIQETIGANKPLATLEEREQFEHCLLIALDSVDDSLAQIGADIRKNAETQTQQPTPEQQKPVEEDKAETNSQKIARQERQAQRLQIEANKRLYLRQQLKTLGISLNDAQLITIDNYIAAASFFRVMDQSNDAKLAHLIPPLYSQFAGDAQRQAILGEYFRARLQDFRLLRQAYGAHNLLNLDPTHNLELLDEYAGAFKASRATPEVALRAYLSSGRELKNSNPHATPQQNYERQAAQWVRQQVIADQAQALEIQNVDVEALSLEEIQRRQIFGPLQQQWDTEDGGEAPQLFVDDEDEENDEIHYTDSETNESPEPQAAPSGDKPAKTPSLTAQKKRNRAKQLTDAVKRSKQLAQSVQKATWLTNPYVVGGAVTGGGAGILLAGLLSHAPGVMAAGGAMAGAGVGGMIGFFAGGPLGALVGAGIGAAVGGIGSYIAGQSMFGGGIAAPAGMAAPTLTASPSLGATAQSLAGSAVQGAGSLGSNILNVTSTGLNALSTGLSSPFSTVLGSGSLVTGTLSVVVIGTVVVTTTMMGAFMGPEGGSDNPYLLVTKEASPDHYDNDQVSTLAKPINYHIVVKPKNDPGTGKPYQVTISAATDDFKVTSDSTSAPTLSDPNINTKLQEVQGKVLPDAGFEYDYTIMADSALKDSRITNTLNVKFTVNGIKGEQSVSKQATVTIGVPPAGGGCWPATGLIVEGPFEMHNTHNHVSGNGWVYLDAIDITNSQLDSPIYTPFAGTVSFYTYALGGVGETGEGMGGNYGNRAVLKTNGVTLLFAHLNKFGDGFAPGGTYDVSPGQQIGYMGGTGNAGPNTYGIHLHYEHRPAIAASGPNMEPATSNLEAMLPEPLQYKAKWQVTGQQYVKANECGAGGSSGGGTGEARKEIGCMEITDGDKPWKDDEIAYVTPELTKMMSDARVKQTLCAGGKIYLKRNAGSGDSGGEVVSSSTINIYDMLFSNKTTFGASTLWHEPGHIIQQRYSLLASAAGKPSWDSFFKGYSPMIPSYPLGKTKIEDFAEAFGMCSKTRISASSGYRDHPELSYTLEPYASNQCKAINDMLNAYGQ